ncbi:unnamed protein product [Rotaria sp. Silwood1]|nr:unnamed protein product [Rotaria sp. Silwood1]
MIQCGDNTKAWYEQKMSKSIVPPYKKVYTILQQNVLNPLLTKISADDEIGINQLATNLTCAVQKIYNALGTAVNGSQNLRVETDNKVVDSIAAVSAKEKEILGKQGEIQRKIAEIRGIEAHVVNSGGIDSAKEARGNAQQQVQRAQQQVNAVRQQLSSFLDQKSSLDIHLSQLQTQLQELNSVSVVLEEVRNSITTINNDLKRIIGHITKILDASSVLYTTINNLINFESLFVPLNAIYNELAGGNLLINIPVNVISNATLAEVKQSLDKVADVLPQMPFNTLVKSVSCDGKEQRDTMKRTLFI